MIVILVSPLVTDYILSLFPQAPVVYLVSSKLRVSLRIKFQTWLLTGGAFHLSQITVPVTHSALLLSV